MAVGLHAPVSGTSSRTQLQCSLGSGLRFEGQGRKDLQVEVLRRHLGGWSQR